MQSMKFTPAVVLAVALTSCWASAQEARLDEVSVTATRDARATRDVPAAIAVVGKERIEDAKMMNVKDGLAGIPGVLIDSKNGGYDAKLVIRGSGLNAAYGIREVMMLRDGVPMTDPDSLSKLDFIDTQDIERIEVTKGPGNLYSPGSAGGAIQIISKSVFDERANSAKLGYGDYNNQNLHLRYGANVTDSQALAFTGAFRAQHNNWRQWNKFDTTQAGLKHGMQLPGGAILESELSYTEANIQLPGSMSAAQFETFKQSGQQTATQDAWKNSGRYSKIWFFNSKYEQEVGDWTFKPRVYYTAWKHYHPVTGSVNDTRNWTQTYGTDLEAHLRHQFAGVKATMVAGLTLRRAGNDDSRQYQFADVTTGFGGRITATISDREGALMNVQKYKDTLRGVFFQESLQPTERLLIDAGFRYDRAHFAIDTNTSSCYDYATGKYTATASASCVIGLRSADKTFNLFSPKLGATYRLSREISVYGTVAQADQVLQTSYIQQNAALDAPRHKSREIGFKGRAAQWHFDVAYYAGTIEKEVVQVRSNAQTLYQNAGKIDKKGLELSGGFKFARDWEAGAGYGRSDYKYASFLEVSGATQFDRAGKQLPFVPKTQYSLYLDYRAPAGLRARLQTNTWGTYYIDNGNTATYDGYKFVTNLSLAYEQGPHTIAVNADNLFDKRYAMDVKKDLNGTVSYYGATPRAVMLTYNYKFR
ncbi:MAG: TonB-dependent receptor [Rhodocyclales bacterium]|nr:TonB-dependent receptor [Rhodocyclales bacterium]